MLVANSVSQHDIAVNTVQPIPFGYTHPMNPRVHGRVYGFDRVSGKKLWTAEVSTPGRVAGAAQRAAAGVLRGHGLRPESATPGRAAPMLGMLCLDKRTGRTISCQDQLPPARSAISISWAIPRRRRST